MMDVHPSTHSTDPDNPQESFHDLRKATEERYLQFRWDQMAKQRAAQRTRRCVGVCVVYTCVCECVCGARADLAVGSCIK